MNSLDNIDGTTASVTEEAKYLRPDGELVDVSAMWTPDRQRTATSVSRSFQSLGGWSGVETTYAKLIRNRAPHHLTFMNPNLRFAVWANILDTLTKNHHSSTTVRTGVHHH